MENNRINFDINKEKFHLTGRRTKILGWKNMQEDLLERMTKNYLNLTREIILK